MESKDPKLTKHSKHSRHASENSDQHESDSLIDASKNSSVDFPPAPDGGWGWVIVLGSFVISVICDGCSFSFGVLFSELLDAFGESKSRTSWVGSLFLGMSLLLGPFASALTTKFGCRWVTIGGGLVSAAGFIASSFANSIGMLCITYGLIAGAGMSMCIVTSVVLVSFYFEKKRALATGLALCGTGIGTSIFAPIAELLIAEYGWRGFLLILGGVTSNMVVCGALFRPLKFTPEQKHQRALDSFEKSLPLHGRSRVASENSKSSLTGDVDEDQIRLELEQISHSQVEIPTFLNSKLKTEITPEVVTQVRKNGSTIEQMLQKYVHNINLSNTDDLPSCAEMLTVTSDDEIFYIGKEENRNSLDHDDMDTDTATKQEETKVIVTEHKESLLGNKPAKFREYMYLPMYRKDIFYRGNLLKLSNAQHRTTSCPELYTSSFDDDDDDDESDSFHYCPHFLRMSRNIKRFIKAIFDPKILLHPLFFLFALSNFILYFWSDVPYVFISDRAIELGISYEKASLILSVMGILNTFGQVAFGYLGDLNFNLSMMYGLTMIATGSAVILIPFLDAYWYMNTMAGIFGFFISSNYTLTTVMLVQYVGLDKLTNACGLLMMIQGVSNLVGPPTAGWMSDWMGSYNQTFYTSGVFIIISGIMMFLVPVCNMTTKLWRLFMFDKEVGIIPELPVKQDPSLLEPIEEVCMKDLKDAKI